MSAWIMGIVGVIALGVLADILLPEGETAKYIKGFLAVFVVAAIVAPIPSLLSSRPEIVQELFDEEIMPDEELLEELYEITEEEENQNTQSQAVIPEKDGNIYITGAAQPPEKELGHDGRQI